MDKIDKLTNRKIRTNREVQKSWTDRINWMNRKNRNNRTKLTNRISRINGRTGSRRNDRTGRTGQIRSDVISRLFWGCFFSRILANSKYISSSLSSYDAMICTNFQEFFIFSPNFYYNLSGFRISISIIFQILMYIKLQFAVKTKRL